MRAEEKAPDSPEGKVLSLLVFASSVVSRRISLDPRCVCRCFPVRPFCYCTRSRAFALEIDV